MQGAQLLLEFLLWQNQQLTLEWLQYVPKLIRRLNADLLILFSPVSVCLTCTTCTKSAFGLSISQRTWLRQGASEKSASQSFKNSLNASCSKPLGRVLSAQIKQVSFSELTLQPFWYIPGFGAPLLVSGISKNPNSGGSQRVQSPVLERSKPVLEHSRV